MSAPELTLTQRKRGDILRSCIEEFRDHGFAAARIDRIAERAQVSKRTLYKHFDSKEAMFDAITDIVLAPVSRQTQTARLTNAPLKDQLATLLDTYVGLISGDEYVTLSRVIIAELIKDTRRSQDLGDKTEAAAAPVEDLVLQAMEAGLLRKADAAYAAGQLTAMLKTFFFWPKFVKGDPLPDADRSREIIDDCLEMFLAHYRA